MPSLQPALTVFPWLRFWIPRGSSPTLDKGYLVAPSDKPAWLTPQQSVNLATLADLENVPCLVLLGDPGTGKSFEITAEDERLRRTRSTPDHCTLRLDLKLRSAALIEREAFSSTEFVGWTEGKHALTLLFDSIDECWRRVPELGLLILTYLRPHLAKKLPPLQLRMSCRAAEWQDEIEVELCRMFGEQHVGKKVQVWQLAPLTRENVSMAATTMGIDASRFSEEVAAREVNAFAAHPITLRMLLAAAKSGGVLGGDRAEIYASGCARLCEDTHQVPQQATPRLHTTLNERLACAGYLAATCVLSNRYLIFNSGDTRPEDETGMLVGGDLLGRFASANTNQIEFTRESLAETLQTALFEAQPGGVYTWRHQSYAEYLAARCLSERNPSPDQLAQLLCDTSSGRPRLWPQLEETACWLATIAPGLFEALVQDNPDVFLRCDPSRLNPEQRKQIVTQYLDQVRRNEVRAPQWSEDIRLNRLQQPMLVAQLEPVLKDQAESWVVRDLAMDIARECALRELAPLFVEIMFAPTEVLRLRHSAGVALRSWADPIIRSLVKQRLTPAGLNDDQDDVRGCVLSILWPSLLTVDELVPLLTLPQRDNYYGSYRHFLSTDLAENVAPADLPTLLRWVGTVEPDYDHSDGDPFDGVCAKIALTAYRSIATPAICAEFMNLVHSLSARYGHLFSTEGRDLVAEAPFRRLFWETFMAGDKPVRESVVEAHLRESGLIMTADFEWVLARALAATTPELRKRWLDLAFRLFSPLTIPEHLVLIWPLVEADEEVAARVQMLTSEPLVEDGESNWQKEHYYREQARQAELAKRKPFSAQVDEALDLYAASRMDAIWWLIDRLDRQLPDHEDGNTNNEVGWKRLSAEQYRRIMVIAPGYLLGTAVDPHEVHDPKLTYRSYYAGLRFLIELQRTRPTWLAEQSSEFWAKWAPVLFVYQDRIYSTKEEVWPPLFGLTYRKAREAFLAALERWLASRRDRYVPIERMSAIPVSTDKGAETVILAAAIDSTAEPGAVFDLFSFLLKQGSRGAEATLRSWQPVAQSISTNRGATLADALLLCHRTAVDGVDIVSRMMADVSWGESVLCHLNDGGSMRSAWIADLPAETIAQLWEWLDSQFSGDPYREDHDGTVTLRHNIYHLRNTVLSCLEGCGKEEAIEALGGLVRRHPDLPWLGQVLAKARHACRRREWKPPTLGPTCEYLVLMRQRPLCSDGDLCDALIASLRRYQEKLRQDNPNTELWNEPAGLVKTRGPKDERNLSDCLARNFNADLRSLGVSAVRESELRRKTGSAPGDEPDIVAYAPSAAGDGSILKVVIEVKCAWNRDVLTSIQQQLHARYLREASCGIHVTGYFTCASWAEEDQRKHDYLSRETLAGAKAQLEAERTRIAATTTKRIDIVVLDARM